MISAEYRILLENNMRGGPRSCMGNRYLKRGEKIVYEKMKNLFGWSMLQYLPTREFRKNNFRRSSVKTKLKSSR